MLAFINDWNARQWVIFAACCAAAAILILMSVISVSKRGKIASLAIAAIFLVGGFLMINSEPAEYDETELRDYAANELGYQVVSVKRFPERVVIKYADGSDDECRMTLFADHDHGAWFLGAEEDGAKFKDISVIRAIVEAACRAPTSQS